MARDPEMVRRAQDVWYPWACGDGSGRLCSEMMADFAADEVERQAKWLRGQLSEAVAQRDSAEARASKAESAAKAEQGNAEHERKAKWECLDRAHNAEARANRAEARVRELEAKRAAQPYIPRVGDVVTWGACAVLYRVTGLNGYGYASVEPCDHRWLGLKPLDKWRGDLRPAERAAAGLPPEPAEAPAVPQVLPEHLAYLEAHAAWWNDGSGKAADAVEAARALSAAVARRDGGGK